MGRGLPHVDVVLDLGPGLPEPSGLGDALRARLQTELDRLRLPAVATVDVGEATSARAFRLRVQGNVLPYPPSLLLRLWQVVAPPQHQAAAVADGAPDAWLAHRVAALDRDAAAAVLVAMAVALTLALVRRDPSALLTDDVAEQYAARAMAGAPASPAALRALLALRGTLAEPSDVTHALSAAAGMGLPDDDAVESAYAALRSPSARICLAPRDLAALYPDMPGGALSFRDDTMDPSWRERHDALEDALFESLGLPLPEVMLVPSPRTPRGRLELWVGDTPGLPARAPRPDALIAAATADRLVQEGFDARDALDPVTARPAAVVSAAEAARLRDAGVPALDACDVMLGLIREEVLGHARRLLAIEDLDHQLALLGVAFPAVVRAATAAFPLGDLLRTLRLLVEEGVPVRDLRGVLNRLLDLDPLDADDGAQPTPVRYADFVRDGLGDHFASRFAPDASADVLYVDAALERRLSSAPALTGEECEPIRDAVWSALASAQIDAPEPVVVTTRAARRALREVLAPELPGLPVLARSELPWRVERRIVGIIASPVATSGR